MSAASEIAINALHQQGVDAVAINALRRQGIHTIGDLVRRTVFDLLDIRNISVKRVERIVRALGKLGLELQPDDQLTPAQRQTVLQALHIAARPVDPHPERSLT